LFRDPRCGGARALEGRLRWRREWRWMIERKNPAWNDLAVGLGLEPLAVTAARYLLAEAA